MIEKYYDYDDNGSVDRYEFMQAITPYLMNDDKVRQNNAFNLTGVRGSGEIMT